VRLRVPRGSRTQSAACLSRRALYRVVNVVAMSFMYSDYDAGECVSIFARFVILGIAKPFVVYHALLQASTPRRTALRPAFTALALAGLAVLAGPLRVRGAHAQGIQARRGSTSGLRCGLRFARACARWHSRAAGAILNAAAIAIPMNVNGRDSPHGSPKCTPSTSMPGMKMEAVNQHDDADLPLLVRAHARRPLAAG
jgi:hypothetical protein